MSRLGKSRDVSLDEKYLFATPAEKANRVGTGFNGHDPGDNPTSFHQIAPDTTSKNAADPSIDSKSGPFKFSKGI